MKNWIVHNNRVTLQDTSPDRTALDSYFKEHVNPNTVFFHSLEEKIRYMTEEGYWDSELFKRYTPEEVKAVFKRAYKHKYRFQSYMGAHKFYSEYATKTADGSRYLERYEDRMSITALARSETAEQALALIDHLTLQTFTPATPTLMNSGKSSAGRLVSCFAGEALVQTSEGMRRIDSLKRGDMALSHDGKYHAIESVMSRPNQEEMVGLKVTGMADKLVATPEHPVLILPSEKNPPRLSVLEGDGAVDGMQWVAIKDVMPGDFIALAAFKGEPTVTELNVADILNEIEAKRWGREVKANAEGLLEFVFHGKPASQAKGWSKTKTIPATIPLNRDFGKLLGIYVAAGCLTSRTRNGATFLRSLKIGLGKRLLPLTDEVTRLIRTVLRLEPAIYPDKRGYLSLEVNSSILAELIGSLVGTTSKNKQLPQFLIDAPIEFVEGFIFGMLSAHGCMSLNVYKTTSLNPLFITQLQAMLLRLNIVAHATPPRQGGLKTAIRIPSGEPAHYELLRQFKGAHELVKLDSPRQQYFKWVGQTPLKRVKEVTRERAVDTVYNLEVEGSHTYSVHGFIVHNCFLLQDCTDSLDSIMRTLHFTADLSKNGGGIGIDLSNLRARGEDLRKVSGASKGAQPVAKLLDVLLRYADQAGQRAGAGVVNLSVMHPDFLELLSGKKIATDEDARLKTLSICAVIPDVFMEAVREDRDIHQIYPHSLFKATGKKFTEIDWNNDYQSLIENPDIKTKKVSARKIMEEIALTAGESGYPYLLFQGNANAKNPIENVGDIHMTNLCSEIIQPTIPSEYGGYNSTNDSIGLDISCNLASLHIENTLKHSSIAETVKVAIQLLDNVARSTSIDEVPAVKRANDEMRSIGLGAMGLHSFLANHALSYGSKEALEFVDAFFAAVHFYARRASMLIAKETGFVFKGFEGSKYQSGEYFQHYLDNDYSPKSEVVKGLFKEDLPTKEDWKALIADIREYGLAHSFVMAIAPTGSISYVSNASASVMPITEQIETRTSGKGKTIYPMPHLSEETGWYYEEAYDIDQRLVIDTVATIQRHVDQGISCTLFVKEGITTAELSKLHIYAYRKGVKTIYYTRTRAETVAECVACSV